MIEIGPHRLLCGDITAGAVHRLMGDTRAAVVYGDPPWGPGNQQYWHTIRERGARPRTDWPSFLAALAEAIAEHRLADAPVFLEMGLRWTDDLDAAMAVVGLPLRRRWRIFYGPKAKPLSNVLSLYGPRDVDAPIEGLHGEPITRTALAAVVKPGDLVLDPCTGMGMTARVTHQLGGVFRGTEMNLVRLARAEAWLRRRLAREARR